LKFKAITVLSLVPPLYCAVLLGINEYKSIFTVEKWMNDETERVYIVNDLLNKYKLNGMTMDEVTTLLGTPIESSKFQDDNKIEYNLGNERGFISIDTESLIIEFDDSKKVVNYSVVRN